MYFSSAYGGRYFVSISLKNKKPATRKRAQVFCTPKGIRTPVAAVKGRCPRPLDDGSVLKSYLKIRVDDGI